MGGQTDIPDNIPLKVLHYFCSTRVMTVDQQVRGYLLYLIGCFIYPTKLKVPLFFLTCLEDIKEIDNYAWGASLLVSMHNGFKNYTSLFKVKDIPSTSLHKLTGPCHLVVVSLNLVCYWPCRFAFMLIIALQFSIFYSIRVF